MRPRMCVKTGESSAGSIQCPREASNSIALIGIRRQEAKPGAIILTAHSQGLAAANIHNAG
jgi:hypothetical protein